jgi:DNA adenine methylase
MKTTLESPFKWAGSKRKAVPRLQKMMPADYGRYFECFLGGGSLFFSLSHSDKEFVLNDFNSELICAYRAIKNYPETLYEHLQTHLNTPEYYYNIRELDRNESFQQLSELERASRFIYLNKTAFNGLWRVNKSNQHNVSFGHYQKPALPSMASLMNCSHALSKATIHNGDFEDVKSQIKKGDFVFLDPAYEPISKTSNFTAYTNSDSGRSFQIRVARFCDYLNEIGAKFMLTNSNAPFILDTYKHYNISKISMARMINCKGDKREKVKEVIVRNYK